MRAKKGFGQNFLVDARVVERIIGAFDPRADETVIEIGAGRGALTAHLIAKAGRILAIEFDRDLAYLLKNQFSAHENFQLVECDALRADFCQMIAPARRARVIANLPYNISTAILQRLIAQRNCLTELVLMLQKEVVERMTAPPGRSERGFLSVLVEAYCETEPLFDVEPLSFHPAPKIWSTVVRINIRSRKAVEVRDEKLLWQLVSAGFSQKRKTIFNNLRHAPEDLRARVEQLGGTQQLLEAARIVAQRRAETLSLEEWARLSRALEDASKQ